MFIQVVYSVVYEGYVYLVFDSEKSIKALLSSCTQDCSNGGDWYFQLSSRRIRCKEVSEIAGESKVMFFAFYIYVFIVEL